MTRQTCVGRVARDVRAGKRLLHVRPAAVSRVRSPGSTRRPMRNAGTKAYNAPPYATSTSPSSGAATRPISTAQAPSAIVPCPHAVEYPSLCQRRTPQSAPSSSGGTRSSRTCRRGHAAHGSAGVASARRPAGANSSSRSRSRSSCSNRRSRNSSTPSSSVDRSDSRKSASDNGSARRSSTDNRAARHRSGLERTRARSSPAPGSRARARSPRRRGFRATPTIRRP
jgi:hypothetical protein